MSEPDRPLHPACLPLDQLLSGCEIRFTRRSGPGGQNRNKVETAVVLTHRATGVTAEASERRTQGENRVAAVQRLRVLLALTIRMEHPPATPSALWRRRFGGGKLAVNPDHEDFPALLAESLEFLAVHEYDPAQAGLSLGCSSSQLVRFLKLESRALRLVNEARVARARRPLL